MEKKTRQPTKLKEQAQKFLTKVPEEYIFWCHDGCVFKDMKELAEGLATMSDETFVYHANPDRNDFSNWVRDIIGDVKLAHNLAIVTSRVEAAKCVATRFTFLLKRLPVQ